MRRCKASCRIASSRSSAPSGLDRKRSNSPTRPGGKVANELLYRHDEPRIEIAAQGRPWSFDGDGQLFRRIVRLPVAEARWENQQRRSQAAGATSATSCHVQKAAL